MNEKETQKIIKDIHTMYRRAHFYEKHRAMVDMMTNTPVSPPQEVSKNVFNTYRRIQFSGKYNMITDSITVMNLIGISEATYTAILQEYGNLVEKYGLEFQ